MELMAMRRMVVMQIWGILVGENDEIYDNHHMTLQQQPP